jgi:hypothetical protein
MRVGLPTVSVPSSTHDRTSCGARTSSSEGNLLMLRRAMFAVVGVAAYGFLGFSSASAQGGNQQVGQYQSANNQPRIQPGSHATPITYRSSTYYGTAPNYPAGYSGTSGAPGASCRQCTPEDWANGRCPPGCYCCSPTGACCSGCRPGECAGGQCPPGCPCDCCTSPEGGRSAAPSGRPVARPAQDVGRAPSGAPAATVTHSTMWRPSSPASPHQGK